MVVATSDSKHTQVGTVSYLFKCALAFLMRDASSALLCQGQGFADVVGLGGIVQFLQDGLGQLSGHSPPVRPSAAGRLFRLGTQVGSLLNLAFSH